MFSEPDLIVLTAEVDWALKNRAPVVALESALITHGLPYPKNAQVAHDMEVAVRQGEAVPATIAVLDGKIRIGLGDQELSELAQARVKVKVSRRDISTAVVRKACGGTTVAATMFLAARQGIRVFATGGIGGVHRESSYDISADLPTLADIPMIVVCAGAKAILDLPATLEYLETAGVPVIGYQVEEFPAFYSRESGLRVSLRLDSPEAIAEYWAAQRALSMPGAILIANPIPEADAIPRSEIEPIIAGASREAAQQGIQGQAVTPFLLARVSELTGRRSMQANEALLLNNARLAARVAGAIASLDNLKEV
jgi:pseudouridine-5'-phosphate glycosidase